MYIDKLVEPLYFTDKVLWTYQTDLGSRTTSVTFVLFSLIEQVAQPLPAIKIQIKPNLEDYRGFVCMFVYSRLIDNNSVIKTCS